MSNYIPGHSAIIAYALDAGAITESSDGDTPAALPAIPTTPVVLGYTNAPEVIERLNNKMGYASGSAEALYRTRGRVEPELSFEIRLGAIEFLQYCLRSSAEDDLPNLCFFYGVNGQYCEVIRKAKCQELRLNFAPGDGGAGGGQGGGELTANATFWGTCEQDRGTALTVTSSQIRAFGTPLMWHDVRRFRLQDSSAAWLDYRAALMSQTFTYNNNLERKNERPNWGDNSPLARTNYEILPRSINVSGETGLHYRLDQALFRGAANAQDWGDMEIYASDNGVSPAGEDAKYFTVTARDVMPDVKTQRGTDAGSQLSHNLTIQARNLDVSTAAPV